MKTDTILALIFIPLFGLLFGIATAVACDHGRPATVYYDAQNRCMYWSWDDEPEKMNPCGPGDIWVPENAQVRP